MADQANPAANAAASFGGMMQGESAPFGDDPHATNQADDIASIFGLGEEAGPVANAPAANSSDGGSDGGASPSGATPAAEGTGEQPSPATPPAPQTPQPGQQGEPSQPPAQPAAPAAPAPAAPPAAPVDNQAQPAPNGDPTVQALQAQVQALTAHLAQLQQAPQQGAGQAPQNAPNGQPAPEDVDPHMDYRFGIPDDVANAIFSEDAATARQGMSHLINSIMRITHQRVLQSVQERVLPRALNDFQQQSQLTSEQERMRQEYFGAYPQHNDPATRLIVAQEAQTLWTLNPAMTWDENARNALGQRVNARLGVATPQQQVPAPAPAPTPVPQPAPMLGSSNRPAPQGINDGDFITSVLTAGG